MRNTFDRQNKSLQSYYHEKENFYSIIVCRLHDDKYVCATTPSDRLAPSSMARTCGRLEQGRPSEDHRPDS